MKIINFVLSVKVTSMDVLVNKSETCQLKGANCVSLLTSALRGQQPLWCIHTECDVNFYVNLL